MNTLQNFPVLSTRRLELREITADDADAVFEIFADGDVVEYYDVAKFDQRSQAENLIHMFRTRFENEAGIRWGIFLNGQVGCIGTCGFNSLNKPMQSTVIGYELNRDFWGQGIMTEALNAVISSAFSKGVLGCNVNRIQADTIPGNTASEKVLLKLGFKEEGIRRQSGYWKNQFHDLKCFGLLKHEFVGGDKTQKESGSVI